ncbi:DUF1349 domain-containing protein [Streptomyces sp. NBC_00287]|uniref:DUF1349 domain-containing protein n=1 Tax=Streptomyces sp. NBC_00287 TaxID=2975702 RepID=UPI002E289414|nr:DUF1349 domain-containing protein [Streptomyces sp. NBC_00287]
MSNEVKIAELPFGLVARGAGAWSTDTGLRLSAAARTDLFCDPAVAETADPGDPVRLVGEVRGDFQLSARVEVDFRDTFDAGVLFLQLDEDRWAKLCFEYTPQGEPSVVSVVTRGDSDDANSQLVPVRHTWLRISRLGRAFAFHSSDDGEYWRMIRYFSLGELSADVPVRVGFLAQAPHGEGCEATFSQIEFHQRTLAGLRDGS